MPWRLIGIIAVFALLLGFIGLNLENTSNLHLGFKEFDNVPVYITVFASFLLGLAFSIPFFVSKTLKKHKEELAKIQAMQSQLSSAINSQQPQALSEDQASSDKEKKPKIKFPGFKKGIHDSK